MSFVSFEFGAFLAIVYAAYWLLRRRGWQNALLLVASYVFYGYIHPWFCWLLAASTVVDYFCGWGMVWRPRHRKVFLAVSLLGNLGMLGFFKYFGFFADNVAALLGRAGLHADVFTLQVLLPVGISFYTFQTLSYTIDIYRGETHPRRNFVDYALYVAFFPQLVAGPIERAKRFLPQIESERCWRYDDLAEGAALMVRGFFKKMVIADNVAVYVDKIFMLEHPTLSLLAVGALAFAVQIYTDFGGYTDIARGTARLLGFHLIENFRSPYLAVSPSDFWRRWHISFSSWIRDYLYIGLGGSRVGSWAGHLRVLLLTMGLAGLWHGAAWHFVIWGLYHGLLTFAYRRLGFGGRWVPVTFVGNALAVAVMLCFTLVGWLLFRTPHMGWLIAALSRPVWGVTGDAGVVCVVVLAFTACFAAPLFVLYALDRWFSRARPLHALFHGAALVAIIVFFLDSQQSFIYFQF